MAHRVLKNHEQDLPFCMVVESGFQLDGMGSLERYSAAWCWPQAHTCRSGLCGDQAEIKHLKSNAFYLVIDGFEYEAGHQKFRLLVPCGMEMEKGF